MLLVPNVVSAQKKVSFGATIIETYKNTPVAGVIVTISEKNTTLKTDENGRFTFNNKLKEGDYLIYFSKEDIIKEDDKARGLLRYRDGEVKIAETFNVNLTKAEKKRVDAREKVKNKLIKKQKKDSLNNAIAIADEIKRDSIARATADGSGKGAGGRKLSKAEKKRRSEIAKSIRKGDVITVGGIEYAKIGDKTLKKENDIVVQGFNYAPLITAGDVPPTDVPLDIPSDTGTAEEVPTNTYSETLEKYAGILGVNVNDLSNEDLYEFIDNWLGTPYLMGGETKNSIDCSSFSQRLYINAYDKMYLERTAQKQFNSEFTELFAGKKYLSEGDLIFFGKDRYNISHVGVYLRNDRFVHSTSATVDGPSGVKISKLTDPYWSKKFLSAGRRSVNN